MKTILHADLNSFYASVEIMQHPELKHKPVAVCGATETRHGIILAKSQLAKEAGVKRIRIHDLRHSHVSMLIDMGFSAVDIAERVGHESVKITYRYAHMFPNRDTDIANKLNSLRGGAFK